MRTRWLLVTLLALSSAASAGCGLKRQHRCTATGTFAGQPVTGTGTDVTDEPKARDDARKYLCDGYCLDKDPAVDAAIRATGSPGTERVDRILLSGNNDSVRTVYDACRVTCSAAATGVTFSCSRWGI